MLLGTDEITILRGSRYYGTWQWINSVTGDPENFAGLTGTIKIKNTHEDFKDVKNTYELGTIIIEPNDINGNPIKGRVDIDLSKEDTLYFQIPEGEDDRYSASDIYSILSITLSTGEVILQAQVRVVDSIESELIDYLTDNTHEAIVINGKLDNILARNGEFISLRDNLIENIIPSAIDTFTENINEYNQNHTNKLNTYNQNHDEKIQVLNNATTSITTDKNIILEVKQEVQINKDSVDSMKTAIEVMMDNFDDRFLGVKTSNPTLDNDGNPLNEGAIYYNSTAKELRFYNGVSWDSPVGSAQTYALQASQSANNALSYKNQAEGFKNTASTKADEASVSASSALASKNASKTSETNAKNSENLAIENANKILNLSVEITTLPAGQSATRSYDPITGILSIGIPQGAKGDKGNAFAYSDFTAEQLLQLKGVKGDPGISAYDVAVLNGFTGTQSQWLISLKGADGISPTVDTVITQNSTKAISSGAVYSAIGNINSALDAINGVVI